MSRGLTSSMLTAIADDNGEFVYLFEFEFSGGTTRLTTAGGDILWNGNTYSAYAALNFESVQESPKLQDQQVRVTIDAVDLAVVAEVLAEEYIGRLAHIYLAYFDSADGSIIADPVLLFSGYMNQPWEITEHRPTDNTPGYAEIVTTLSSPLVKFSKARGIRGNSKSHQNAGANHPFSGDTFFGHVQRTSIFDDIEWGKIK